MSTAAEIERAVRQLPAAELAAFRAWFLDYDHAAWDEQIARDAAAGRLDTLSDEALADLRAGRTTEL